MRNFKSFLLKSSGCISLPPNNYASELKDLRSPPGNRLENLSGNLQDCYSIRINDQWRIVFKWDSQPYDVRIIDYH